MAESIKRNLEMLMTVKATIPQKYLGLLIMLVMLASCKGSDKGQTKPETTPTAVDSTASSTASVPAPAKLKALAREGGTLVRAATDDALYIADEDHGVIRKVPLPLNTERPPVAVPMPGQPAQVLALADKVLVTIRSEGALPPGTGPEKGDDTPAPADPGPTASGKAPKTPVKPDKQPYKRPPMVPSATGSGLLLILRPDADKVLVETARVALPQDAWGIAITADESLALVTSAWTHKVSAVDLNEAKLRWTVDVSREPRAVVIHPNQTAAYVTHLVGADLTRIDDIKAEPKVRSVVLPPSPLRTPMGKRLHASLGYSAVLSPDGSRLFVPRHALGAMGPQVWFGASAVDVLLTHDDKPLAPMRGEGPRVLAGMEAEAMFKDLESGGMAPRITPTPFAQPRAVAYRKGKNTLLVVSEGYDTMVELDARSADPAMNVVAFHSLAGGKDKPVPLAKQCGGPSGIAVSDNGWTAWIFCRSTYNLVQWTFSQGDPARYVHLADDLLPAQAALGRRIFHDATDPITSGGLACSGCHPEGRDDGHVWHEAQVVSFKGLTFVAGLDNVPDEEPPRGGFARQTPMLAGRVAHEGPYGWHAESGVLTQRLIAGFELHRWFPTSEAYTRRDLYDRAMALRAFLRKGLVPPPRENRELTDKEKRGKQVFLGDKAGCATCHVPTTDYSDREAYDLFSKLPVPAGFIEDPEKKYKTPSLLFVGSTPPYMHDGRFPTLRAVIEQNGNRMGNTTELSATDRDALVAFLETL